MKLRTVLLWSLVANLGLATAAVVLYKASPAAPAPTTETVTDSEGKTHPNSARKPGAKNSSRQVIHAAGDAFNWTWVESPDYKKYIANLRGIECPEETIKDIIVADVNKLYGSKMQKIRGGDAPRKYWEGDRSSGQNYFAQQREIRVLEKEKRALFIDLLGYDPSEELKKENGYYDYYARNFDFLSEDKRDKARDLQEKYQELKQKVHREGIYDEVDRKTLRELDKQMHAEMAQFLTPQEMEEYDVRASDTANSMRYSLSAFEPTESEFREIFKAKQAHEDEMPLTYDPEDKEAQKLRDQLTKETDAQVKNVLGEARFAEYKRAQDYSYQELTRLTDKLELPKTAANAVYDMKKAAEDAANQVRSDKNLTSAQRTEALQKIRDETEKAATETLGESGLKKYQSRGGWWINNISPKRSK